MPDSKGKIIYDLDQAAQCYELEFAPYWPAPQETYVRSMGGLIINRSIWDEIKSAPSEHPEGGFDLGVAIKNAFLFG